MKLLTYRLGGRQAVGTLTGDGKTVLSLPYPDMNTLIETAALSDLPPPPPPGGPAGAPRPPGGGGRPGPRSPPPPPPPRRGPGPAPPSPWMLWSCWPPFPGPGRTSSAWA